MSIWDDFYRLDYLDLAFVNNFSAEKATIFANGKNQISISIKVKIVDKYNNQIVIPADELANCVYLVKYRNGNRLNWKGNSSESEPWCYTDVINDYNNAFSYDRVLSNTHVDPQLGEQEVIVHLYTTSGRNDGIDIAAGIHIPGVGDFDTTESGTSTKNGPKGKTGVEFIVKKKKYIEAKQEINYGDKINIAIDQGGLVYNNSFKWSKQLDEEKDNGQVWTCAIRFYPKQPEIKVFKEWSITYDALKNKQINRKYIWWQDRKNVKIINCAGYWAIPNEKILDTLPDNPWFPELPNSSYPYAVFHKANLGNQRDEAHINFWHAGEGKFQVNGNIMLFDKNKEQILTEAIKLDVETSSQHKKTKVPTIQLYKFFIPQSDTTTSDLWKGGVNLPTVRVIDHFGNSGEFKLTFDDKDNFDVPGIV